MRGGTQAVVIIGAGGHAREVADVFEAWNAQGARYDVLGHVVDAPYGKKGDLVRDRRILGDLDWFGDHREVRTICAVGDPTLRRSLATRAAAEGARFCNAIHPSVQMTSRVRLGEGVLVASGTVLTSDIVLGDHTHINTGCTVNHDCVLEDFATLSPGVHLAGGVHVGEGSFVGIGATAIDRRNIGAWSLVGAGAVVIRDVAPHSAVVGVPAHVISQRDGG